MGGARNLNEVCKALRCDLDMFVLYSSTSALLNGAGQANYAAANAVLDGLARERRSEGLQAVSVQWDFWSEAGMAADAGLKSRFAVQGLHGIGNAQ